MTLLPHIVRRGGGGFTLIEVMLASVMAAMILLAVYAVFSRAIKLRDSGTARMRLFQVRTRASRTIRTDLENAWISGGVLANVLESSTTGSDSLDSAVPGYFKFTTTTGKDTSDDLYGDVQQVEYYIAKDDSAQSGATPSGKLVRVLTRDLLDETATETSNEEQLLAGVQSFTVSFYDGTTWQTAWSVSGNTTGSGTGSTSSSTSTGSTASNSTGTGPNLPEAIRIDIQQIAPSAKENAPPPLEIMVPWTSVPFATPTPTPGT